jgi:hypothetical protein
MTSTRIAILCLAASGGLFGQSFYGSVTSAGCGGINGWAWNSTAQTSPLDPLNVALLRTQRKRQQRVLDPRSRDPPG